MPRIPVAVQLFTLREQTKDDFAGIMKQVASIGYSGVELAGFGNLKSAAEVKKAVDDAGLRIAGAHVGIEALESELNRVLDEQDALANKTVIVPWLPDTRRQDAAGWKQVAQSLNQIAQAARKRDITIAYHNHSFEFQKFDGKSGFDILWENSDPKLVKSELDVYWVRHGGADPVDCIAKLASRIVLLHLKDMAAGADQRFAPVGTGMLDIKAILAAGQRIGVKWNIVEQDNCYETPPLDAVRISYENLKKMGAV